MSNESVRAQPTEDEGRVRRAAFQLLLTRQTPIEPAALAEQLGMAPDHVIEVLDQLDLAGRIRRDPQGQVTGSGGLSVTPDRHEIEINGRRFWTWCAYDIFGIFGALGADGSARSGSPAGGAIFELTFDKGRPRPAGAVLFRPDASLADCCENVYEEWCPNSTPVCGRARGARLG